MPRRSESAAILAARGLTAVVLALLCLAAGGCASSAREADIRDELRAFADTASTRVNIVADRLGRQTDDVGQRAALNREKIGVAGMGIDNAMQAHAMTGLLDMTFQFDLKARSARQRVQRLTNPGTQPARPSDLDPFADELLAVHEQNRDEIWKRTAKRLRPAQLNGLRAMIDEWYAANRELNRSSVQIAELQDFAGNDPSRSLVFSLVNLQDTNEQVDSIVWGAQRLYDNSHWQVRRVLFDAIEELERPRDETIAAVSKAVADEREKTGAAARALVNHAGRWLIGALLLAAMAAVAVAVLLRRGRPPAGDVRRAEIARRVDAIERAIAASRPDLATDAAEQPKPSPSRVASR